ncbi:MAG: cytochrome c oxidase accessory protein CcoG [Vicinamibacteria bacterium]|nr:cytochrome c oxidase accessory protein CcoG [Vicinamibacteria bacterium]
MSETPVDTFVEEHQTFRDELATIARDGRRRWIYARQPSGRLYRARTVVSVFLLAFLVLAPFVHFRGQPLVMLNVIERRFVLFGTMFWPQDFYLVVLIALGVLVTLALSTVTVGRVWCGWLCPQTIFMEMLFRKLEFWLDGSAGQQLRRDHGPWDRGRIMLAVRKHAIVFALSFGLANVFLAWIIGKDDLWRIVTDPPRQHVGGLTAITIFSLVFYGVFARFREQACVLACPYGRVMSSLIDPHTITVTYDSVRGEPRGKRRKDAEAASAGVTGDCIDCFQCVTICPTGIDIRDGIQMECVNCTACIDACNDVMRRVDRPEGLIRLTSHEAMRSGTGGWLTARVTAYGAVWLVLVAVVAALLWTRRDLDVLVLRQPGTLYTTTLGGDLANFYTLQAFNRSNRPVRFSIDVVEPRGATVMPLGPLDQVGPHGLLEGRFLLRAPTSALTGASTPVRLAVRADGEPAGEVVSSFLGPASTVRP